MKITKDNYPIMFSILEKEFGLGEYVLYKNHKKFDLFEIEQALALLSSKERDKFLSTYDGESPNKYTEFLQFDQIMNTFFIEERDWSEPDDPNDPINTGEDDEP